MKKIISVIIAVATVFGSLAACGNTNEAKNGLSIVCSTFPVYDFVKNVAGDYADITLLDSTTDIHSFEPTAQDLITLSQADLFVCIGGVSDAWVDKAISSAENESLSVLKLMSCVSTVDEETVEGMQAEEEEEAEADEHIWLSLKNAKLMCEGICNKLCEIESQHSDAFKANYNAYSEKLSELDKQYENTAAEGKNNILVFADRFPFRYLCEDYGLEYFAAFPGCSSETSASFETVSFLISKVKENDIHAVLVTESSDMKMAETINKEAGTKTLVLNSCQSTHLSDIENGASYLGIMTNNLEILKEALS